MIVDGKWFPGGVANLPCPDCATFMELVTNPYKGGDSAYYRCPEKGCRGSHGAHPDGSPLGIPASQPTKDARIRAHDAFDVFWKGMAMRRGDAYRWLAKQLQLEERDCHIGQFSIEQCERVIAVVGRFRPVAGSDSQAKKTPHLPAGRQGRHRRRPS